MGKLQSYPVLNILHLPSIEHLGILGYWLVFLIAFAESLAFIGLFTPGTILIVLAGGLSAHGVYDFGDLMFFSAIGAILGDGLSYELGKRYKSRLWQKPRWQQYLMRGRQFIERHGTTSVFLGRFVGPLRPIVPVVAGTVGMRRTPFYVANIFSAVGWAVGYLALGYVFGAAWKVALAGFTRVGLAILVLLLLSSATVWLWRIALRKAQIVLTVLLSIGQSLLTALAENPYIRGWIEKHTNTVRWAQARFSTKEFTGLPLTLLACGLLYSSMLFTGLVEDYVTNDQIIAIDVRLANLLYAFRDPGVLRLFYIITLLAESPVIIALSFLLTIVLWRERRRLPILTLWITVATSQVITMAGKLLFHRFRPEGLLPAIVEDSYSFPSGHATSAAAFYGFLAYLIIRSTRSWKARVSAVFLSLATIFLIDLSRLYLGVHYLSDVLTGNLVGMIVLLFAISVFEWLASKRAFPTSKETSPWKHLTIIGAGMVVSVIAFVSFAPSPWKQAESQQEQLIQTENISDLFKQGQLPPYTETLLGTPQEPLNVLIIGSENCLLASFEEAGWHRGDTINLRTIYRLGKTALLNEAYPTAPMTPSFYDTRPHDFGFEKETDMKTVRSRHHARFWRTHYMTDTGRLFVGTVSLDTGLKWGITHAIAPDIDTERDALISELEQSGQMRNPVIFDMIPPRLGKNFSGDPFFTNGKAVILTREPCDTPE